MGIKLLFVLSLLFLRLGAFSQAGDTLGLEEVIKNCIINSNESRWTRHEYNSKFWQHKLYQSDQLPKLSLTTTPLVYNQAMIKRYDFENNLDIFREQKNIYSYANLRVEQNVAATGGKVYIDSDISRLNNISELSVLNYNATALRFGLIQPLWNFNAQKLTNNLANQEFKVAEKEYIRNIQKIKLKSLNLFFTFYFAYSDFEISQQSEKTAKMLYEIGVEKTKKLAMQYKELLQLRQNILLAKNEKIKAELKMNYALQLLNQEMGKPTDSKIIPISTINNLPVYIDIIDAQDKTMYNSPDIALIEIEKIRTQIALNKTISEYLPKGELVASYGFNKSSETLAGSYQAPYSQEYIALNFSIALVDWGSRKQAMKIKKNNLIIAESKNKEKLTEIENKVNLAVINYNKQSELLSNLMGVQKLASEIYMLTEKQFLIGELDMMTLNYYAENLKQAKQNYLRNLFLRWTYYYEIEMLTGYDYRHNKKIIPNFNKLGATEK